MSEDAPSRRQVGRARSRWVRSVVLTLLALLIPTAGVLFVLHRAGKSSLRQALDELAAAGEPLTFADIEASHPRIPNGENGALVLLEVMPLLDAAGQSELLQSEPVPYLGDTPVPAWDEPWPEETLAAVSAYLRESEQLLKALDRLHDLPRGRFRHEPGELHIEHLRWVRSACKHKVLQAIYEAQAGRLEDAADHLITALHINATVSTEPQLASMLVSAATDMLACRTIERLLAIGSWSDAGLADLPAVLAEHEQSNALVWALRGELAWSQTTYDSSRGGLTGALSSAVWFARDTAKAVELLARLLQAAKSRKGILKEAGAVQAETKSLSGLYVTTKMRMPPVCRACTHWERRTAMLRCTMAALAAERFRITSNRWPSSLEELVPEYLDAAPSDPFNDLPLKYKLTDDLLTIYSVGENGRDDGGRVEWTGRKLPDVGFRLLAPEKRISGRDRSSQ